LLGRVVGIVKVGFSAVIQPHPDRVCGVFPLLGILPMLKRAERQSRRRPVFDHKRFLFTRLETRTKESNVHASFRVSKLWNDNESEYRNLFSGIDVKPPSGAATSLGRAICARYEVERVR